MTVQELIDELQKVDDKGKVVQVVWSDSDSNSYHDVGWTTSHDATVEIHLD